MVLVCGPLAMIVSYIGDKPSTIAPNLYPSGVRSFLGRTVLISSLWQP